MLLILPLSITLCCRKKAAAGLSQDSMQQVQDRKCQHSCIRQWLVVSEHIVYDLFRQSDETHELVMKTPTSQQPQKNNDIEMISSHCSGYCWHSFSTAV